MECRAVSLQQLSFLCYFVIVACINSIGGWFAQVFLPSCHDAAVLLMMVITACTVVQAVI